MSRCRVLFVLLPLLWSETLESRAGAFTRVPARLPTRVERRTSDVSLLAEGEALALIGTSERDGFARAVLLLPQRLSSFVPWEIDERVLSPDDPDPATLLPSMPSRIAPARPSTRSP